MSPVYPSLDTVTDEAFDKVVGVNSKGPFRLTALVASQMERAGRGGSIINISSIASVEAAPHALPYAGAKAALNAITTGFAVAYGPAVRVNGILAGRFATNVAQHWPDPPDPARPGFTRSGKRVAAPEEIVGLATYLASDAASFTSGAMIRLDGGPRAMRREPAGA